MCLSVDGQHVLCDGKDCLSTTPVPVALRPTLNAQANLQLAEGWLFVIGSVACRHYCPLCAIKVGPRDKEDGTAFTAITV